jgi:hypothetical protein
MESDLRNKNFGSELGFGLPRTAMGRRIRGGKIDRLWHHDLQIIVVTAASRRLLVRNRKRGKVSSGLAMTNYQISDPN